jgi:aldose 1-epimerase
MKRTSVATRQSALTAMSEQLCGIDLISILLGSSYQLPINNGPNSLHGGKEGFNVKFWTLDKKEIVDDHRARLIFSYTSNDGEEVSRVATREKETRFNGFLSFIINTGLSWYIGSQGHICKLKQMRTWLFFGVSIYHSLLQEISVSSHQPSISWQFEAHTTDNKSTIVNCTNHAYWNLSGKTAETIDHHRLELLADRWMPCDSNNLVTGEVMTLDEKSPLNMHHGPTFAELFKRHGDIDNPFLIERPQSTGLQQQQQQPQAAGQVVARLFAPDDEICMTVSTTEPCIQVYTGNYLTRNPGHVKHGALCLETQRPPNAINIKSMAHEVILPAGQTYRSFTQHTFSKKNKETSTNTEPSPKKKNKE